MVSPEKWEKREIYLLWEEVYSYQVMGFRTGHLNICCCCCSIAKSCLTLCYPMDCRIPDFPLTISQSLLKLTSRVRDAIQPSLPLPPTFLLFSIFPSIRVFSNESALCIRWPKDWSFSLSLSPANEYSGWFPLRLTGLIHGYNFKIITNIFWPFCLRKKETRLVAERKGSDGHPMN